MNLPTFLLTYLIYNSLPQTAEARIETPTASFDVLISIVQQFKEWDLVLHLDSQLDVRRFLLHEDNENLLTIFNYDVDDDIDEFRRPYGAQRCVNFVWLTNSRFLIYAKQLGNVNEMDVIVFLSKELPTDLNYANWYTTGVDNANAVFILTWTKALTIYFYTAPGNEVFAQEVKSDEHGIPMLFNYRNSFRNFYGFNFKIGYTNCPPFVVKDDDQLIGVEFEVLKIVTKKMNMSAYMDNFSLRHDPRIALIDSVNKSDVHFGIGCLATNARRNEMVAFSSYLHLEPHITVYGTSDLYGPTALYAIMAPLQLPVWICCIVALILMSILVKLLVKQDQSIVEIDAVLIPTQILLEQATLIPGHSNSLRFGLFLWILVGYALSSSYKSKLTSALIMPEMNEPTSLDALLDQGYGFISPATDSTYLIELLKMSTVPAENKIAFLIEDTKVVCDAIERALAEKSAIIEERTVVRYELWNHCIKNLTKTQILSIRRLKDVATVNGHVWAMQRSAPYKSVISLMVEYMKSYGLIEKWYTAYNITQPLLLANARVKPDKVPLRVIDLMSAWIVIAFGITISAGIFLLELCTSPVKAKILRPRRRRVVIL